MPAVRLSSSGMRMRLDTVGYVDWCSRCTTMGSGSKRALSTTKLTTVIGLGYSPRPSVNTHVKQRNKVHVHLLQPLGQTSCGAALYLSPSPFPSRCRQC